MCTMIASAIAYGSLLILKDRNGNQVGSISMNGGEFIGNSSEFVVLQYGNMIMTFDESQHKLGSVPLPENYRIGGINDAGFYARVGNTLQMYDPFCNYLGLTSV